MGENSPLSTWLHRFGFVGVSSTVLLFGFVRGLYHVTLHIELAFIVIAVGFAEAMLSTVIFTAFVLLSGAIFLIRLGVPTADTPTDRSRAVTAIVPVYRDGAVLHRSVESLLESTYDAVQIRIVCEPGDATTIDRARDLAARDRVECFVNDERPGSKASAINYAAARTDSDLVAVFDADEVVHPEFVESAVARLEDADVVQGRTVPETTGVVESLAYCESVVLSYVSRRLLYIFTGFRMAASRAVVMDRAAFEAVGGYDEEMLTEDFEFAHRCYKARLTVVEDLRHPSRIEAAHTMRDWWGQRKRWLTGYAQVLHRLIGEGLPPGDRRDVLSLGICASTVWGSLLCLTLFSKFAVVFVLAPDWLVLIPLAAVMSVALAVRLTDVRSGVADRVGLSWTLVPLVFPLYSLAAIKAVLEYVFSWDGEWYHVTKRSDRGL